jgi:hypothetical protein
MDAADRADIDAAVKKALHNRLTALVNQKNSEGHTLIDINVSENNEGVKDLLPFATSATVAQSLNVVQRLRLECQQLTKPKIKKMLKERLAQCKSADAEATRLESLSAQQRNNKVRRTNACTQPLSGIELKKQLTRTNVVQQLRDQGHDLNSIESRFAIASALHDEPVITELLPQINSKQVIENAANTAHDTRDYLNESDDIETRLRSHVKFMEQQAKACDKQQLKSAIDKIEAESKQSTPLEKAKPAIQENAAQTQVQVEKAQKSTKKKKKKKKAEEGNQSESTPQAKPTPQEQNNQQANAAPAAPAEKQPTSSTTSSSKLQAVPYTQVGIAQQKENEELEKLKEKLLEEDPQLSVKQLATLSALPKKLLTRAQKTALHGLLLKAAEGPSAATSAGIRWPTGPSIAASSAPDDEPAKKSAKPKPSKQANTTKLLANPYDLPDRYFPPQSQKELTRSEREDMDFCRQFDLSTRPLPELSSSSDSDDGKEPEEPANMSIQHLEELQREQQKWVSYKTAAGEYRLDTEKLIDGTEDRKGGHFRGPNDERELLYESPHGSIVRRNVNGKEGITTCFAPGISPEEIIQEVIPTALDRGEIRSFKEQPGGIVVVGLRQEAHKPGQDPRYPQDIEAVIDSKNGKVLTLRPDLPLRRLK